MEIKSMGTRIGKLMWILIKIAIMGLIVTGIILINKKYMSNAEGSEKGGQKTSIERVITPGLNT
jgi:hypothetical protein